ncbi:MAG: hypothetical protein CFE25_15950 [Chitinophagaceae bacterium BSSC1]|nr:MAG: hypothetical protein CFE25_15950 [Chitinophagaceae bacterium BSSC1]
MVTASYFILLDPLDLTLLFTQNTGFIFIYDFPNLFPNLYQFDQKLVIYEAELLLRLFDIDAGNDCVDKEKSIIKGF